MRTATELISIERYPIDDVTTQPYRDLVARCQSAFRDQGVALLPGFVTSAALQLIAEEAQRLVPKAFFCRDEHNVYLSSGVDDLSNDHPRNRFLRTDVGSIASDYLDPQGAMRDLYNLSALTRFIADVVQVDRLFLSSDPLGAVTINVFAGGDAHDWHFDESRFSVTLMVQPAERGGHFEYRRGLREDGASDGDVDAITAVLDDASMPASRLPFEPGTLSIFAGRHTLHRVTPVHGEQPRLVPVLTYSETPGYRNSDAVRQFFWGRTG